MVDGPPKVFLLAVDPDEHLVQMPAPMGVGAHMLDPLAADLGGEHWTEPVPPEADGFMADVDATLEQQVLDVPE